MAELIIAHYCVEGFIFFPVNPPKNHGDQETGTIIHCRSGTVSAEGGWLAAQITEGVSQGVGFV
jgi:hypothetical protein